jgi:hypothetical protein
LIPNSFPRQVNANLREFARLEGMLLMPFTGESESESYAINRRSWPVGKAP